MPWLKIFLDSMKQIDLLWHQSAFHSFLIQSWFQIVWVLQMPYQNIQISSQSNCYKCCSNLHFLPTCPESWKNWKHTQTSLPWVCPTARVQTYLRNIFLVLRSISASSSFYCVTARARNRPSAGRALSNIYICLSWHKHRVPCVSCDPGVTVVSADSIILHHRLINTDTSRQ